MDGLPYVLRPVYYGFAPLSPEKTLKDGGKCDDKSLLLRELLRTRGIESNMVYVVTEKKALPEPPQAGWFDHIIVYVPAFDVYLDSTDRESGPTLPKQLAGAPMLDSATGKVGRLPTLEASKPLEKKALPPVSQH